MSIRVHHKRLRHKDLDDYVKVLRFEGVFKYVTLPRLIVEDEGIEGVTAKDENNICTRQVYLRQLLLSVVLLANNINIVNPKGYSKYIQSSDGWRLAILYPS